MNYSDHSCKNVLDIFEEVTAVSSAECNEYSILKGVIKNEITFISLPQKFFIKDKKQLSQRPFNFNCKIKSYLHLLQLF